VTPVNITSRFDTGSTDIIEELERLRKEVEDKDRVLKQKELEIDRSHHLLNTFNTQIKEI
jgi:peptidoglycan hydrolase CwlO-like protein